MFGGNTNKTICQFYSRGQCKYGDKCWNIHSGPGNYYSLVFPVCRVIINQFQ